MLTVDDFVEWADENIVGPIEDAAVEVGDFISEAASSLWETAEDTWEALEKMYEYLDDAIGLTIAICFIVQVVFGFECVVVHPGEPTGGTGPPGESNILKIKRTGSGNSKMHFKLGGTSKAWWPADQNDSFVKDAVPSAYGAQLYQSGLRIKWKGQTISVYGSDGKLYISGLISK